MRSHLGLAAQRGADERKPAADELVALAAPARLIASTLQEILDDARGRVLHAEEVVFVLSTEVAQLPCFRKLRNFRAQQAASSRLDHSRWRYRLCER